MFPMPKPSPDEPIIDVIGRLALLAYRLDACRSGKRREVILRDLQAASDRLDALLVAACGPEPIEAGGPCNG